MLTKDFVGFLCSCSLLFFAAAHFQLAASISHFLTTAMKFSWFSSNEIVPLALSLLST